MLNRLGLVDLQIKHLESKFQSAQDPVLKKAVAGQLLQTYAQQVMSNNAANLRAVEKLKTMVFEFPDLATPSMRIVIAQADYLENERQFRDWQIKGSRLDTLPPLNRRWQTLIDDLDRIDRDLQEVYEDQLTILRAVDEEIPRATGRLAVLESELARTTYLRGWSRYFSGVINPGRRIDEMRQSDQHFRKFLQLDPKSVLLELKPKWVDFSSLFQRRALVGLAMCQRGLNHPDQSEHCFSLLDQEAGGTGFAGSLHRWKLNARVYVNDFSGLDQLLNDASEDQRLTQLDRTKYWSEVWRASLSVRQRAQRVALKLRQAAINGLAREFQAVTIREMIESESIPSEQPVFELVKNPFLAHWVQGYLDWESASLLNDDAATEKRVRARQHLQTAVEIANEQVAEIDQMICRFLLLQVQLADANDVAAWQSAARSLESLASQFGEKDRLELAAFAQWLSANALAKASQFRNDVNVNAVAAIDRLRRRYPGSPFEDRAELLKLELIARQLTDAQAIRHYQQVAPDSPNAVPAAIEIVKYRLRQWNALLRKGNLNEEDRQELQRRWQAFEEGVRKSRSIPSVDKVQLAMINLQAAAGLLRRPSSTRDEIDSLLDRIRDDLTLLSQESEYDQQYQALLAQWHFHQCDAAIRFDDFETAKTSQAWLFQHDQGSGLHRSATIELAHWIDEQYGSGARSVSLDQAVDIFGELVELLGDSDEVLQQSSNARVAYFRLAQLYKRRGESNTAGEMVTRLVGLFPKRKDYRKLFAQTLQGAGDVGGAYQQWKMLAAAETAGTDAWYEAKIGAIQSLMAGGKTDDARKLLDQTKRLSPTIPERWQSLFDRLDRRLSDGSR
ncbi:MAG: hypothetical protein AAFN77_09995 [Planctomycetota bacterium]